MLSEVERAGALRAMPNEVRIVIQVAFLLGGIVARTMLLIRIVRSRPRLFFCVALGAIIFFVIPDSVANRITTKLILSWNVGAWLYLALAIHLMYSSDRRKIQSRAVRQDDGRIAILVLVIVAAVATIGAIAAELGVAKELSGTARYQHVALAALTLVSSWFFTHVMFALHYAHDYELAGSRGEDGGLEFAGKEEPDYLDFLYFSCIIGTSGQTADVNISTSAMRRTALVHCVLAFFYNATLIALTINIASGFF